MSTNRKMIHSDVNQTVHTTSFVGSGDRGGCFQISQTRSCQSNSIQMTHEQVVETIRDMFDWLNEK